MKKIILFIAIVLLGVLSYFNHTQSKMVKSKIIKEVKNLAIANVNVKNINCYSLYGIESMCYMDLSLDKNGINVLDLKNSLLDINFLSDSYKFSSKPKFNEAVFISKIILFKNVKLNGKMFELAKQESNKIYKNLLSNLSLTIKIQKNNNLYHIDSVMRNYVFKIKTVEDFEYVKYDKPKIITLNTRNGKKQFKLPDFDIKILRIDNYFTISNPDKLKNTLYDYYKFNYYLASDKKEVNNYFVFENREDLVPHTKFNSVILSHAKEFKDQDLRFFNLFSKPIAEVYLGGKTSYHNNNKKSYFLLEEILKETIKKI